MSIIRKTYTKNVRVGTLSFSDDSSPTLNELLRGLIKVKKIVRKGHFKDVTLSFYKQRNWNENDESIIDFRGSRPETKAEKAYRSNEYYRNYKYYEKQYEESKALYVKYGRKSV